jgi:hypothetical protein
MTARQPPTPDGELREAESLPRTPTTASAWSENARRLVALGYITAVGMPFVGFILGISILIRLPKPNSKHGAWIIAISVVASVVWVLIIASGALKLTTNDINS